MVVDFLEVHGVTSYGTMYKLEDDGRIFFIISYYGELTGKVYIAPETMSYIEKYTLSTDEILFDRIFAKDFKCVEIGEFEFAMLLSEHALIDSPET